jgi:hypothetical protein
LGEAVLSGSGMAVVADSGKMAAHIVEPQGSSYLSIRVTREPKGSSVMTERHSGASTMAKAHGGAPASGRLRQTRPKRRLFFQPTIVRGSRNHGGARWPFLDEQVNQSWSKWLLTRQRHGAWPC